MARVGASSAEDDHYRFWFRACSADGIVHPSEAVYVFGQYEFGEERETELSVREEEDDCWFVGVLGDGERGI